ncbi:MAG: sulfatase-like hydrolase/transferase [Elusimicrobia bacterium]|nr:sulfatase-like hydrolase/transferase [Elusimicrobiota bacterium]
MQNKISFHLIAASIKNIILMNVVYLICMSIFRLVFFVRFADMQELQGLTYDILRAFYMGMRFDLVVVSYITYLVTLTFTIVWIINNLKIYEQWLKFVKFYYFTMFSLAFFILCVDSGFYSYFKSHINTVIFGVLEDDTKALFTGIAENYNLPIISAGLVALFGVVYFIASFFIKAINFPINSQREKSTPFFLKFGIILVLIALNVISARGSFGLFPLGTMDADISPNIFVNKLCLNGITTFQEAIDFRLKENNDYDLISAVGYSGDIEGAFAEFLNVKKEKLKKKLIDNLKKRTPQNSLIDEIKPNVIIIVMESFGSDLIQYNSESFNILGELKKHFDSDYVFYNFLSGDIGTTGSLETIMLNIPQRLKAKFISQSKYAYHEYQFAAALPYKKAGYETIFLYGGDIGWRNMSSFAPRAEFDFVEGQGSMDPGYEKNQWGVYDEYLFDHIYKKLSQNTGKPKFILAMTTTNHPPYSLPKNYNKLSLIISKDLDKKIVGDKKLSRMRFETYQYSCQKVGELITRIKKSKFGQNTLIAVTGDHNFWDVFNYSNEQLGVIDAVPFYLYVPNKLKNYKFNPETFGSHLDIISTLYNLSLSGKEYISLGKNMFANTSNSIAFNADGIIMDKDGLVKCDIEKGTASYYIWDQNHPQMLLISEADENHNKMIKYYKTVLAIAEYLVKNP